MTYKERLMATLNFEKTDRVPSHIIGGNSWIIKEDGISYAEQYAQPDVGAASIVQHFKEMNNGVVTCGNAGDRIESAIEMGVNVFSIDAMVDMEDMLRRADHKLCMMGSLSPTDQLMLGTPDSVYKESIRLLELAEKNGGGFILSSGCDIPAGCPLVNLQAMHKAAEDFASKQS